MPCTAEADRWSATRRRCARCRCGRSPAASRASRVRGHAGEALVHAVVRRRRARRRTPPSAAPARSRAAPRTAGTPSRARRVARAESRGGTARGRPRRGSGRSGASIGRKSKPRPAAPRGAADAHTLSWISTSPVSASGDGAHRRAAGLRRARPVAAGVRGEPDGLGSRSWQRGSRADPGCRERAAPPEEGRGARPRCRRRISSWATQPGTRPRTVHALAISSIEPSPAIGRVRRSSASISSRRSGGNDITYPGAGPWPARNGAQ